MHIPVVGVVSYNNKVNTPNTHITAYHYGKRYLGTVENEKSSGIHEFLPIIKR